MKVLVNISEYINVTCILIIKKLNQHWCLEYKRNIISEMGNRCHLLVNLLAVILFLFLMSLSIMILQKHQIRLLNSNRIILPFNQIGERVPQLFWSTQEVGIRTSIFWKSGRYQAFFNSESHNCRSSFWHDVDRSPVTGRILWLSESQGSVNWKKEIESGWLFIAIARYCLKVWQMICCYQK